MTFLDQYAYASTIKQYDPKAKLLFAILPLVICIAMDSILVSAAVLILMGALTLRFTQIGLRRYIKFLMIPLTFLLLGTLTILVTQHPPGTQLLIGGRIGDSLYGIDTASLMRGGNLILKSLAAVSCTFFLSFNTPMTDLFSQLGKCKKLDVVVSLMELIYRYIFVLWDEAMRMKTAQESRLGYRGFKNSLQSLGSMVGMLFLRTYQRCDRMFAALESRGFQGNLELVAEEYDSNRAWYLYAALLGGALIVLGIASAAWTGGLA